MESEKEIETPDQGKEVDELKVIGWKLPYLFQQIYLIQYLSIERFLFLLLEFSKKVNCSMKIVVTLILCK